VLEIPSAGGGVLSLATNTLSYLILACGIATIVVTAYLVLVSYSKLPAWDGWIQIDFAASEGPSHTLDWLWHPDNGHRMVIPNLFLLADLRWFHATQAFLLASIFVIQLLHLWLLGWSMRVLGEWRGALWRTGFGLTAFCLFCPSQRGNFVWGIATCFVLPGLFATLSFIGLLLYWMRSREYYGRWASWKYLVLSIAAALGATYSLSNGNLLWPLLVAAALLLRLRIAAVLTLAVSGIVSTTVYLYNYIRLSSAPLEMPVTVCKYLAAYFGSSFVPTTDDVLHLSQSTIRPAELVGIAGLLVFSLLLMRLPSYIRSRRFFSIQLVLTLLFCVGTGVLTAWGRSSFGVGHAFSSRYQTVALVFWCCMALLLLCEITFWRSRGQNVALLSSQVLLLGIMLVAAYWARTPLTMARFGGFHLNAAGVALITDVPDVDEFYWTDYPNHVLSLVPYMRSARLSVFSGSEPDLLGEPLSSEFNLTSTKDCTGKVESTTVIANDSQRSLRIKGWAWDNKDGRPPAELVIATDGIITGLGVVGDFRPINRETNPAVTSNFSGFIGYVRDVQKSSTVEVYAVTRKGKKSACYLATLVPSP
jgi:hypothetical protein